MSEFKFMQLEDDLHAKVERLRSEGFSREQVADLTADDRKEALDERSAAFAQATAGRGKPSSYGHGKPKEKK